MNKARILFFAADPHSAPPHGSHPRLLLDEEVREIRQKVRTARYRDDLVFDTHWAARTDDLLLALNETDPRVVHFSGHGGNGGLVLTGAKGSHGHPVDAEELGRLFKVFRGDIRVVVLNACLSLPQAEAVAAVVGCAIGTRTEISDAAAIIFSSAFYRAIGFGRSVRDAFDQARLALDLEHLSERDYVQLVPGPGVDPSQLFVIPPGGIEAPGDEPDEARPEPLPLVADRRGLGRARLLVGGLVLAGMVAAALKLGGGLRKDGDGQFSPCAWAGSPRPLIAASGLTSSPPTTGRPSTRLPDLDRAKLDYEAGRYAAAFPRFRRFAQNGNPEAMGFVGLMFLRGLGVRAYPDSGIYWLRAGAYRRDPQAMTELGSAYQSGDGVDRSLGRARDWYHKAADEKHWAEAMRRLGASFRDEQDYGAALLWYRSAMQAGSLDARIDAGGLYELGQGTPRDPEAARCLYQTAAEAGSIRGMLIMGRIFENGLGVPRSYERAAKWYRKAVDAGSPEGMYDLAVLYLNGRGVPRDTAQARAWFERAKNAGYRTADGSSVAPRAS